jgi:hypothetical protein
VTLAAPLPPAPGPEIVPSGVVSEARAARDYVDLHFPFEARIGGIACEGVAFSRRSVTLREPAGAPPLPSGPQPAVLRFRLSGFVLELEFLAEPATGAPVPAGLRRYRIARIGPQNQTALARLIRFLMTGVVPGPEDIAAEEDDETPLAAVPPTAPPPLRRGWLVLSLAASLAVIAAALVGGSLLVHRELTTLHSDRAVLTAPRIDLVSAVSGRVAQVAAAPGGTIARDQAAVTMTNAEIAADLASGTARVAYYDAILADAARGAGQGQGRAAAPEDPALRRERDYAMALLLASRQRATSLQVFSPCTCLVLWAADAGQPVRPGDRLMTLVRTGDALTVEVQVPVRDALGLRAGRKADLVPPGPGRPFRATLRAILSGPPDGPVAGRPATRADGTMATLVFIPDTAPELSLLGVPLKAEIQR